MVPCPMLNRDAGILVDASVEATSWLAHFWAALAGAALGSISGPVTACELSAVLDSDVGACVPAGVGVGALAGALIGLVAAPLCQHGSRRRQPAAQRPAGATWAAAGLVVTAVVAAVWVWLTEWAATQGGLASLSALLAAARGGLELRVASGAASHRYRCAISTEVLRGVRRRPWTGIMQDPGQGGDERC
jgi:hypothetical protein